MDKKNCFKGVLETFENADLRLVCEECIDLMPDYFFEMPASTTGKYHPAYALGNGGLLRHTLALVNILNYHMGLDCYKEKFDMRQRDLLRIAGIMHDAFKKGLNGESEEFTSFVHPLVAAKVIREANISLGPDEKEYIASAIESHMGQWNTDNRSEAVLPTPKTDAQIMLHTCDYLASRKDLGRWFDAEASTTTSNTTSTTSSTTSSSSSQTQPEEPADINTYKFPFGKYKGMPILEIPKDYLEWLKKKAETDDSPLREPLKGFVDQILAS